MHGMHLARAALLLALGSLPAGAQEPLHLRIRPMEWSLGEAVREGAQAMAEHEAVWQRADQRSRLAIASVCVGCLAPNRPLSSRPRPEPALPRDAGDASPSARPDPTSLPFSLADLR